MGTEPDITKFTDQELVNHMLRQIEGLANTPMWSRLSAIKAVDPKHTPYQQLAGLIAEAINNPGVIVNNGVITVPTEYARMVCARLGVKKIRMHPPELGQTRIVLNDIMCEVQRRMIHQGLDITKVAA